MRWIFLTIATFVGFAAAYMWAVVVGLSILSIENHGADPITVSITLDGSKVASAEIEAGNVARFWFVQEEGELAIECVSPKQHQKFGGAYYTTGHIQYERITLDGCRRVTVHDLSLFGL